MRKLFQVFLSVAVVCFISVLVFGGDMALAETTNTDSLPTNGTSTNAPASGGATVDTSAGLGDIKNSTTGRDIGIANVGNPAGLAARIVSAVLRLVGVLFFLLIVYAGFLWMTSAGNSERVTKAKQIFSGAVIGLTIVLMAYYLVDFVFGLLASSLSS